jgi:hypothetical protein
VDIFISGVVQNKFFPRRVLALPRRATVINSVLTMSIYPPPRRPREFFLEAIITLYCALMVLFGDGASTDTVK